MFVTFFNTQKNFCVFRFFFSFYETTRTDMNRQVILDRGIAPSHKEVKSAADEGTLLYFNTLVFGYPPIFLFLFSFFPLTS